MTTVSKLLEISMKLNLEIINFQQELYSICQTNISKEELLEVTEDINYIVGNLTIQNLAIETILSNIKNNSLYEKNNQEFLNTFLGNIEDYCTKYNVGECG